MSTSKRRRKVPKMEAADIERVLSVSGLPKLTHPGR